MKNKSTLIVLGILLWVVIGSSLVFEYIFRKPSEREAGNPAESLAALNTMFETFRDKRAAGLGRSYPHGCKSPETNSGKYCGLYYEFNNSGKLLALISASLAAADCRADGNTDASVGNGFYIPVINITGVRYQDPVIFNMHPRKGYWFGLLKQFGREFSYNGDFAQTHYGMVAFPAHYGKTGETMFVINESGTVFAKDNENRGYIDTFPSEPSAEGWVPVAE